MGNSAVTVKPASPPDESSWREMWGEYCTFYGQTLAESVTDSVWARATDAAQPVNTILAWNAEGQPLGFANYVLHPHTWSDRTICYLEDLFVRPNARGCGVGHALIDHLIVKGKREGWGRVYWHTETNNAPARRLYDRFVSADDFVRYTIKLGAE